MYNMIPFGVEFFAITAIITNSLCDNIVQQKTEWAVFTEYVEPRILSRNEVRDKRFARLSEEESSKSDDSVFVSIGNWTLKTVKNDRLVLSPILEMHWVNLGHLEGINITSLRHYGDCDVRQGHIVDDDYSVVVLTICADDFYVMLSVDDRVFYIHPATNGRHILEETKSFPISVKSEQKSVYSLSKIEKSETSKNSSDFSQSTILEFPNGRIKRESGKMWSSKGFYNLTGDTFDLENETRTMNFDNINENGDDENDEVTEEIGNDEELDVEDDSDVIGYFFDRTWEKTKLPKRKSGGKELPPRWLELAIAIDYSVINFHGSRVQQYVLALLNIVSAIYKDPSLDSNLSLVIVRMVFYAEKSDGLVQPGNARKSLENVNKWNRKLLSMDNENHDIAVWLTRLDIGGPSGYAPVSGACDPARSCALNRDEGLTSAFIIAHEVAHILGLSHDGDETAGNKCGEEASMGSIMAPMVAATFHRFHWSSCSRKEFHRRSKLFQCLDNKPSSKNSTANLRPTPREAFTMDEQCRMEFGEGYGLCRSFDLPGPCSHLWCGHAGTTQICKTKKGPPLEGTACGENKWCINGYCDTVDRKRFGLDPVINNARNGGWNAWSSWSKCSRPCGIGVQFRFRQCNEPVPAYGGKYCEGNSEDFRACEITKCSLHFDLRQQECLRLPSLVGLDEKSQKFTMNWLPHEADEEHLKCRLSCRSAETGEIFVSQENLLDGTPCSYGVSDICVQGTCRRMGCNNVLNSEEKIDSCGVCNGDNSTCLKIVNVSRRKIRRGMTRISIIPRASYNVSVEVKIDRRLSLRGNATFTIRDGRRRRNDLTSFDSSGRTPAVIVEGAAFRCQKFGDGYEIWARGPVQSEVIVALAVPDTAVKHSLFVSVVSRYIVNKNDSSTKTKYSWIPGGWSPCSTSCGGGTRHKTVACKDDETGRIVNRKKCSLLSKPIQQVERCNIFSCKFKWIPGHWEGCSATCGHQGVQHRQIYCVHSSFKDDFVTKDNVVTVHRIMASPIRCKFDRPPESKRECNRSPCPGNWIFTNWSACSRSCGKGMQTRIARCVSSNEDSELQQQQQQQQNYECEDSVTPAELRTCRGPGRRNTGCDSFCRRDKSKYCVLMILKRYCRIPGFRRQCCRSCLNES